MKAFLVAAWLVMALSSVVSAKSVLPPVNFPSYTEKMATSKSGLLPAVTREPDGFAASVTSRHPPDTTLALTKGFSLTVHTTFTPLHTYFISTTGSDSNNCLSTTTACASVNASGLSSIKCGDVILVAAGTYSGNQFNANGGTVFPTVGTCPSTTGGIDGAGGVYFAVILCAGSDLMSCKINNSDYGVWVQKSNWAFEGFWATTPIQSQVCFLGNNNQFVGDGTVRHHVAFINNICSTAGDAGWATTWGSSTNGSFDQTAVVGAIGYNAANSQTSGGECGSAISMVPNNGPDHTAGTHVYIAGAYLGYNTNTGTPGSPGCNVAGGHSDGENIIFDTEGGATLNGTGSSHTGYVYQNVVEQSVLWHAGGSNLQIFPTLAAGATPDADGAQYFISDVTMYAGDQDTHGNSICEGDFHFHSISPNVSPTTTSYYDARNNIVVATVTSCGGLGVNPSFALHLDTAGGATLVSKPVTITGNYIYNAGGGVSGYSNSNFNAYVDNTGSGSRATSFPTAIGTNTFSNPGLASPTSLPFSSSGPDCTGYENVALCMNTKYSVYTHVTPTIAPTTVGYQPPISGCSTKTLSNGTTAFPSWLKGIVYLHASGFTNSPTITQRAGLITMPCGL